ncbi:hypothetical protein ACHAPU_000714 [Fusarium lateritium]
MSLTRPGLYWDDSFLDLIPRWEYDPDLDKIRAVCEETLQAECSVSFLTAGAFNRIYTVKVSEDTSYVMRISLSVDPRHKTAGEVATLNWLGRQSIIPVPKVIAFDNTSNNKIGFDWILMEKISGSTAYSRWRKTSMEDKKNMVEKLAGYHAHLMNTSNFRTIGTLKVTNSQPVPGRISSIMFFLGSHFDYDIPRGPFSSSHDWLHSYISIIFQDQIENINEAEDEEDTKYAQFNDRVARKLLALLPKIFPPIQNPPERTVLWHQDLQLSNIMVDEKNSITGIIDWECVSALPYWVTTELPKFLMGRVREEEPQRDEYGDEEPEDELHLYRDDLDNEGVTGIYWEHLMEYEKTQLRKVYSHHVSQQYPRWDKLVADSTLKSDFLGAVSRCATGVYLKGVERWIDVVNGGQFPRLDDVLRSPEACRG